MFHFNNSYADLPERFHQKVNPTKVNDPSMIQFNTELAAELGLPNLDEASLVQIFSGNQVPEGAEPLAQAYAGHQFGHFVPQLGDGRAILLGEIIDKDGKRRDLQLKGSGRTQFSRSGDGRAWLGPVIREYIVSEAMYALGVPSTRSLAAVLTGEDIYRESKLPGAILTRVASSHIRIGTFEYFAARRDTEGIRTLANYVIDRHYPEIKEATNPYETLLQTVSQKQSDLILEWMSFGFVHGVMNTDNMSVAGETIDYGPCAFMDSYDPDTVFSSIDRYGRYAYQNQAAIVKWNLSCFANTLLPLIHSDQQIAIDMCSKILDSFESEFSEKLLSRFLRKIGIEKQSESDNQLVSDLLNLMYKFKADFTLCFRYLSDILLEDSDSSKFYALFDDVDSCRAELDLWIGKWRLRLQEEGDIDTVAMKMKKLNPAFIPRNHRIEEAIQQAHQHHDFSYMKKLLEILSNPFKDQDSEMEYMQPPINKNQAYVTFCGT